MSESKHESDLVEAELEQEETNPRGANQTSLFGEWWEEEWKGMPEFVQPDAKPLKTLYVHFESYEDVQRFAELVGQRLTMKTLSIWYPEADIVSKLNKRYVQSKKEGEE